MPQPDRAIPADGGDTALWAEAQRLYEQTDTPAGDIAALLGGQTAQTLYRIAHRRGWRRHGWSRSRNIARKNVVSDNAALSVNGRDRKKDALAIDKEGSCNGSATGNLSRKTGGRARGAGKRIPPAPGRQALIRKLERTVAREISAIDARLRKYAGDGRGDTQGIDHERHAKALATLARTLRELAAIDRPQIPGREEQRTDIDRAGEEDNDDFPRDVDALRDTLARRLEQLSPRGEAR